MKLKHTVWIAALSVNACLAGEPLFSQCSVALKQVSYSPLAQKLLRDGTQAAYCQRLNNREFIYTTDQNFYYCKFDDSSPEPCSESTQGNWYPDLALGGRFSDSHGKQFAVFKTDMLSHGIYDTGVQIFYLTPKTRDPRGYQIVDLKDVGEHNGLMSDGGQLCGNLEPNAVATEALNGKYEIVGEGTARVGLRFLQRRTHCPTGKSEKRTVEYMWSDGEFKRAEANN